MTDKMLECLNALIKADPDAAEMTLLRKSRLAPDIAGNLPFYVMAGYRGDAEITPLNILNASLRQVGQEPIGYVFDGDSGRISRFVEKAFLPNVDILKQYEGEFLKLPQNDNRVSMVAHRNDCLITKIARDRWDVYKGISFDIFTELVLSTNPAEVMSRHLEHRSYATVNEEPK